MERRTLQRELKENDIFLYDWRGAQENPTKGIERSTIFALSGHATKYRTLQRELKDKCTSVEFQPLLKEPYKGN